MILVLMTVILLYANRLYNSYSFCFVCYCCFVFLFVIFSRKIHPVILISRGWLRMSAMNLVCFALLCKKSYRTAFFSFFPAKLCVSLVLALLLVLKVNACGQKPYSACPWRRQFIHGLEVPFAWLHHICLNSSNLISLAISIKFMYRCAARQHGPRTCKMVALLNQKHIHGYYALDFLLTRDEY